MEKIKFMSEEIQEEIDFFVLEQIGRASCRERV